MRKRHLVVRDIHRVMNDGGLFSRLSFGGKMPCSGDLLAIQLAVHECDKFKAGGLVYMAALFAAAEIERKTGFINYAVFLPVFGGSYSSQILKKLCSRGLLERVPFPDTFSHLMKKKTCYKLSEDGRKCLRLFSDTFNMYQREVKRAKIKGV